MYQVGATVLGDYEVLFPMNSNAFLTTSGNWLNCRVFIDGELRLTGVHADCECIRGDILYRGTKSLRQYQAAINRIALPIVVAVADNSLAVRS